MKLSGKSYLIIASLSFISCRSTSKIQGTYVLEKNTVLTMRLTLNEDGSFVQNISERHCQGNWYFGFYKIKKGVVQLAPVSFPVERLWRNDTIVYYSDTLLKKKGLFVYDNGKTVADNAEVYVNNYFLGKTDRIGYIELPVGISIDSLTIKTTIGLPKTLKVEKKEFNVIFAIVYDYGLEPCGDLYFQKEFRIRKNKLVVKSDSHFLKEGFEGYLEKTIVGE